MVIQRWQTLCLLVAVILMAGLDFVPLAWATDNLSVDSCTAVYATEFPILVILGALTAVLLFIDMFMYKNLRAQMRVAVLCVVLMLGLAVTAGILVGTQLPGACIAWSGAVPMLAGALIFTLGARMLMRRDYNLLHNADRLR